MKGLIGKKLGNTQIFDEEGRRIAVTVIQAGPCLVVEKRSHEKDGYESIQLGFEEVKEHRISQPILGQFKSKNLKPRRHLKEFRGQFSIALEIGQEIDVDIFKPGELVDVTGKSKGKGFAGTMKRHNFSGGPSSHGSMSHRRPASAGGTAMNRCLKGKKGPGQMGNVITTSRALTVIGVDKENHLLLVSGAVPGAKKTLIIIKESKKAARGG